MGDAEPAAELIAESLVLPRDLPIKYAPTSENTIAHHVHHVIIHPDVHDSTFIHRYFPNIEGNIVDTTRSIDRRRTQKLGRYPIYKSPNSDVDISVIDADFLLNIRSHIISHDAESGMTSSWYDGKYAVK